ncbi:unnamed protein product [Psylliodes chrysocephalus]|uniref:Regulatory protein zeste n=1 Tax=Psylliodes chrysocephalus TaxID=3402493 RepID=A0A9P0CIB0_9CUCU|nr:unnamed protein product [Psylliodes chrysocephala]
MEGKRQRSTNFSHAEQSILLNIISKYKNKIENKKTDSVSVTEKNRTWEKIQEEFNALAPDHSYRAAVMLKKFYENKKKNVRKVAALEKTEIIKTGGGPPPNIKKDSNHDLILGLMNVKTVYGLDNEFDSDNQIIAEPEDPAENEEFVYEFGSNEYWTIEKDDNMFQNEVFDEQPRNNPITIDSPSTSHVQIQTSQTVQTPTSIMHTNEIQIPSSSQTVLTPTSIAHHPNKVLNPNCSQKLPTPTIPHHNKIRIPSSSQTEPTTNIMQPHKIQIPSCSQTVPTPTNKAKNQFVRRKRPATVVRALTSSRLAEKYDDLVDRRLRIAERTENEFKEKTAEHLKRMELLDFEIAIKKRQLNLN